MTVEKHKIIFWTTVALLGTVLSVLVILAMEVLGLKLGHRHWGNNGGPTIFPCWIVAGAIVTVVFRRLGLLKSDKITETLHRVPSAGPIVLDSPVELRVRRSLWLTLAVTITVFSILIFVAVLTLPAVPGTKPTGFGIALFFGLFSLGPWYGYLTHAGLIACVDQEGVRGESALPKSSIHWVNIASCEITLLPQPWGQVTRYTFRDATDKTLMRLMLADGTEQKRFLAALRECFG